MDFLQRPARWRQVLAKPHPIERAAGVDAVDLRRRREHLLEARELEVVDVEPPAALADPGVERARRAIVAFHRHRGNSTREARC
ncbi:MAG: hypothetical protein ACFCVA_00695 [Gammaproteobacteria bacterium]